MNAILQLLRHCPQRREGLLASLGTPLTKRGHAGARTRWSGPDLTVEFFLIHVFLRLFPGLVGSWQRRLPRARERCRVAAVNHKPHLGIASSDMRLVSCSSNPPARHMSSFTDVKCAIAQASTGVCTTETVDHITGHFPHRPTSIRFPQHSCVGQ